MWSYRWLRFKIYTQQIWNLDKLLDDKKWQGHTWDILWLICGFTEFSPVGYLTKLPSDLWQNKFYEQLLCVNIEHYCCTHIISFEWKIMTTAFSFFCYLVFIISKSRTRLFVKIFDWREHCPVKTQCDLFNFWPYPMVYEWLK